MKYVGIGTLGVIRFNIPTIRIYSQDVPQI